MTPARTREKNGERYAAHMCRALCRTTADSKSIGVMSFRGDDFEQLNGNVGNLIRCNMHHWGGTSGEGSASLQAIAMPEERAQAEPIIGELQLGPDARDMDIERSGRELGGALPHRVHHVGAR